MSRDETKKTKKRTTDDGNQNIGDITSVFMDSGAFTLYNEEVLKKFYEDLPESVQKNIKENGGGFNQVRKSIPNLYRQLEKRAYRFYETEQFWNYVDAYAKYIKDREDALDFYANVDVVLNPEISWRVLRYLEDHWHLNPVPVLHWGTPLRWFRRHLKKGYELIGVGGLGPEVVSRHHYTQWADKVFEFLCPGPDYTPIVKTHGFALTSWELMRRYPWWSVDSASWLKAAGFGGIIVPRVRTSGEFDPNQPPFVLHTSAKHPDAKKSRSGHFLTLRGSERDNIVAWLNKIKIPVGKVDENNEEVEYGVISNYKPRYTACLRYFEWLVEHFPSYPQKFEIRTRKGLIY
jgi:hypothetical protein